MHRRPYFKLRYGAYLKSEHGIKKFAEMAMGHLIRNVTKNSAFYREMNENLLVEKANLRMRAEELFEQPMLSPGEFFSIRRRLWANNLIITAVVLASIFLIFVSTSAFLLEDTGMGSFLQWTVSIILASVLTGGGLIVTERLIESLIPLRRREPEEIGRPIAILWAILFIGIELAILGITQVRADLVSTSQNSSILYAGFIAFGMMLPVIAGTIRWDAMRFIDSYKTARAHREIDSRLAQIDSIIRQNEEYESNFYKIRSIEHWGLINEFRTYKDLYNERIGMVEQLGGHFVQTYDSYQREAYKRYESDLRDMNNSSMRHLDFAGEIRPGRKIGQLNSSLRSGAAADLDKRNGGGKLTESDIYLAPKPVR